MQALSRLSYGPTKRVRTVLIAARGVKTISAGAPETTADRWSLGSTGVGQCAVDARQRALRPEKLERNVDRR